MDRFTSKRERRLWLCTLLSVIAVYTTLIVGSSVSLLYNQAAVTISFVASLLMMIVAVAAQGFRLRSGRAEIGVLLGIGVVYYMVFVRVAIPERSHLFEYGVVSVFAYEALVERRRNRPGRGRPAVLAIAGTAVVGVVDECIQAALPHRVFDKMDMVFNTLAAAMSVGAMLSLRRGRSLARRWKKKKSGR